MELRRGPKCKKEGNCGVCGRKWSDGFDHRRCWKTKRKQKLRSRNRQRRDNSDRRWERD